jgi:glycosyltransferase involved in cell wall biosynthesis
MVAPLWLDDQIMARKARVAVLANPEETGLLRLANHVIPLPNGFDFPDKFSRRPHKTRSLVFFGSLFYHPNRDGIEWFCKEVWPRILLEVPDARLDVVGLWGSEVLGSGTVPGVTLRGFAEDLSPWIIDSAGLVVPLRIAGGTRLKILEAWAGGLPVVSTTMGAEGLGAVHEETVLLGDEPTELAHSCIRLLRDPQLGVRLAGRAFQYGKSRFDWRAIYPTIDRILAAATGQISQSTSDLRSFHI